MQQCTHQQNLFKPYHVRKFMPNQAGKAAYRIATSIFIATLFFFLTIHLALSAQYFNFPSPRSLPSQSPTAPSSQSPATSSQTPSNSLSESSFYFSQHPIPVKSPSFPVSYQTPTITSSPIPAQSAVPLSHQDKNKFELEIAAKLKEETFVPVIIEIYAGKFSEKTFQEHKKKIRKDQNIILSSLTSTDFKLKYQYLVVPYLAGEISKSGLDKLNNNPLIKSIYAEKTLYPQLTESIPLIKADKVHKAQIDQNTFIKGKGQVICVIDTGIDYTHPDLGGCLGKNCKVIAGKDFADDDNDPMDEWPGGHGTDVAGIIAANGKIKGVAPEANLLATKIVNRDLSSGKGSYLIAALDWCVDNKKSLGTTVITMSLGSNEVYDSTNCPTWLDEAINTAYNLNIPVTIGAGNGANKNGISHPACSPNAISVGAVYDKSFPPLEPCLDSECTKKCIDNSPSLNTVVCFTNTHKILDLLAPGFLITTTKVGGGQIDSVGTSMSTPHVAGTIALMKQYKPDLTIDEILSLLKSTGVSVKDPKNGLSFPRINAFAALNAISPLNTAPVLRKVGDKTINTNEKLSITLKATDTEKDILKFYTNAENILPSSFIFNENTGIFEWTPSSQDAGIYQVIFGVIDNKLKDEETIKITVNKQEKLFIRGDANQDNEADISDAIKILLYLYSSAQLSCKDAADANDDGKIDISDPQYLLDHIFKQTKAPPQPYPNAGADSTSDNLGC